MYLIGKLMPVLFALMISVVVSDVLNVTEITGDLAVGSK